MDAQGPHKPRPYVESAGAEFTTVVDEENLLGEDSKLELLEEPENL